MTTDNGPRFAYSRPGLRVEVYANRIEFEEGTFLRKKRGSIPMRSIASVEVHGISNKLRIRTSGEEKYEWNLGNRSGQTSEDARRTILELM